MSRPGPAPEETPSGHGPTDDPHDASWTDEDPFGADPRLQAGAEHLQRAAREVIAASRALLDVAEELVEDPRAAGDLLGLVTSVGELFGRAGRPAAPRGHEAEEAGGDDPTGSADPDDDPPVQRIPVS